MAEPNFRRNISGLYAERGVWRDSAGNHGELNGSVSIVHDAQKLVFEYADGERHSSALTAGATHVPLAGRNISGMLYLGDDSLILEYDADVKGRPERNTDVWVFQGDLIHRVGAIHQADRTIWFEASMVRSATGSI
jgi:hypothetical protein